MKWPLRTRCTSRSPSDGLDQTEIAAEIRNISADLTRLTVTARFATEDAIRHAVDIDFVDGFVRSCAAAHDAIQIE